MTKKNLFSIRYVSQRTGLTPHLIRAWEKRYKAVVPKRSPKNRRLYSEIDIQRLRLLREATTAGHTISQVADLSPKELLDLVEGEISQTSRARLAIGYSSQQTVADKYFKACLNAVLNLEPYALESSLDHAAIELTRPAFLRDVIIPLFNDLVRFIIKYC